MDSKKALELTSGDLDKAEGVLREKGLAKAATKSDRTTAEGLVGSYIHAGSRIGALIELKCETDFVARTPEFADLAHNIAMQVAAMNPMFLDESEMPKDNPERADEVCLLQQAFIKDTSKSIGDLIMDTRARVGENVRVSRFTRFGLGE